MQADDIALRQKVLKALDGFGVAVTKLVGLIEENNLHAERRLDGPSDELVIHIIDTGIGIA